MPNPNRALLAILDDLETEGGVLGLAEESIARSRRRDMVQERRRRGRKENSLRSTKRSKLLMPLPTIDERLSAHWDGISSTSDDEEEKGKSSNIADDVLSRLVAEFQSKTSSNSAPHQIEIDDDGDQDNENSLCESNDTGPVSNIETPDVLNQLVAKFQAESGKGGRSNANLTTTQAPHRRSDDHPTEEERAALLSKCVAAAGKVFAAESLTFDQLKEYESICSSACSRLLGQERRNNSKINARSSAP